MLSERVKAESQAGSLLSRATPLLVESRNGFGTFV
jgi:hypothetical protein